MKNRVMALAALAVLATLTAEGANEWDGIPRYGWYGSGFNSNTQIGTTNTDYMQFAKDATYLYGYAYSRHADVDQREGYLSFATNATVMPWGGNYRQMGYVNGGANAASNNHQVGYGDYAWNWYDVPGGFVNLYPAGATGWSNAMAAGFDMFIRRTGLPVSNPNTNAWEWRVPLSQLVKPGEPVTHIGWWTTLQGSAYHIDGNRSGFPTGVGWVLLSEIPSVSSPMKIDGLDTELQVPSIANQPVANLNSNSAVLHGLVRTGDTATAVFVLWGTDTNAWAHTNWWPAGAWTNNTYPATNIVGLAQNTTYYYTFGALYAQGVVAAAQPVSFTTFGQRGAWWQKPVLKYREDTGATSSGGGPHFMSKDESGQYLFFPSGFWPSEKAVLYNISSLISATNDAGVAPLASASSSDYYGGSWTYAWRGGGVSDDLGLIMPGNFQTYLNTSLPLIPPWAQNVNVFTITNDSGYALISGLAFNHDSTKLYSCFYSGATNANTSKLYEWNVGNLRKNGIGLFSNAWIQTSASYIHNLSVYNIGGRDIVYYGDGNTGTTVYAYDTVARTESRLIADLPADAGNPDTGTNVIVNVKVGGVAVGQMHLYVQLDSGALYVYDLASDGRSVVGSCVKSFTSSQITNLLGLTSDVWTGAAQHMRCFEVTDDEQYAFFSHHRKSTGDSFYLYVVQGAPEIGVQEPAGADLADGISTSDFGTVSTEWSAQKTYTITNSGGGILSGLAVTKDGTDAAMFAVNTNVMSGSLAPGGRTTFTVTFSPTSAGAKTAAIHIASNDSDENPFDIGLAGNGTLAPAPPTGFTATAAGTNRIDLAWTDNTANETGYVVDWSPDSNAWTLASAAGVNATNHSDTGLTMGTLYYYRVAASNAEGLSAYAYASATTWSAYEAWRHAHFPAGDLTNAVLTGDGADYDNDGLSNQDEYLAGTHPTNPVSRLVAYDVTPNPAVPGEFLVRWQSATGRVYTVQASTNLGVNGFDMILRTNVPATPMVNVYTDTVQGAVLKIYRIRLE